MGFIKDEVDSQISSVVYQLEEVSDKIKYHISNFYNTALQIFRSSIIFKFVLILIFILNIKFKYLKILTPKIFFIIMIIVSVIVLILMIFKFVLFIRKVINSIKSITGNNSPPQIGVIIKTIFANIKKIFAGTFIKEMDYMIESTIRQEANKQYHKNVSGVKKGLHDVLSFLGATSREDIINIADNKISPIVKEIFHTLLRYGLIIPLIVFSIPLAYFILSFILSCFKINIPVAFTIFCDIIAFIILWKKQKCQN